jgi:hypothetical protein
VKRVTNLSIMLSTICLALLALSGCTGKTADGKPCRKNHFMFFPSFSTTMADVCPQSATKATAAAPAPSPSAP